MVRSISKGIVVALAIWASVAHAGEPAVDHRTFTESERLRYEALIDAELDHWLNLKPRFPEQRGPFLVKSRIDMTSGYLTVELGREFGPFAADLEMEDLSKEIDAYVEGIVPVEAFKGVKLLFGGGDLYYWFPELDSAAPKQSSLSRKRSSAPDQTEAARVLVSAGHGAYFHHGFIKWTTQRDEHNGVIEDYLTQDFSETLGRAFSQSRPRIIPIYSRSLSNALHEESGLPWRNLAARYWIKEMHPLEEGIWNSMKESKSPAREC
ncbi:hypothetical protein [Luteibacter yeojuensis]